MFLSGLKGYNLQDCRVSSELKLSERHLNLEGLFFCADLVSVFAFFGVLVAQRLIECMYWLYVNNVYIQAG